MSTLTPQDDFVQQVVKAWPFINTGYVQFFNQVTKREHDLRRILTHVGKECRELVFPKNGEYNVYKYAVQNCISLNRNRVMNDKDASTFVPVYMTIYSSMDMDDFIKLPECVAARMHKLWDKCTLLKAHHDFVVNVCSRLDKQNTMRHTDPVPHEIKGFLWSLEIKEGKTLQSTWRNYVTQFPKKSLLMQVGMYKAPTPHELRTDVEKALERSSIESRASFQRQRVLWAVKQAAERGDFIVFDTLTFSNEGAVRFEREDRPLYNHFRRIKRACAFAAGYSKRDADKYDGFEYVCVPEYGGEHGRLHFHVVYMMRNLPRDCQDPNKIGMSADRSRREIGRMKRGDCAWSYGFNAPIAVRFQGDAFTRLGWYWPIDKKTGKAIESKPPVAVAAYVTKYIGKQRDQKMIQIKARQNGEKGGHLCLTKQFRVRYSRNLGIKMLSMEMLSNKSKMELARLPRKLTPVRKLILMNAKRALSKSFSELPVSLILEARSLITPPDMIKLLETLIHQTDGSKLLNSIALMTDTIAAGDISNETYRWLDLSRTDRTHFRTKATKVFGGK